jgi:hypothetical protein
MVADGVYEAGRTSTSRSLQTRNSRLSHKVALYQSRSHRFSHLHAASCAKRLKLTVVYSGLSANCLGVGKGLYLVCTLLPRCYSAIPQSASRFSHSFSVPLLLISHSHLGEPSRPINLSPPSDLPLQSLFPLRFPVLSSHLRTRPGPEIPFGVEHVGSSSAKRRDGAAMWEG